MQSLSSDPIFLIGTKLDTKEAVYTASTCKKLRTVFLSSNFFKKLCYRDFLSHIYYEPLTDPLLFYKRFHKKSLGSPTKAIKASEVIDGYVKNFFITDSHIYLLCPRKIIKLNLFSNKTDLTFNGNFDKTDKIFFDPDNGILLKKDSTLESYENKKFVLKDCQFFEMNGNLKIYYQKSLLRIGPHSYLIPGLMGHTVGNKFFLAWSKSEFYVFPYDSNSFWSKPISVENGVIDDDEIWVYSKNNLFHFDRTGKQIHCLGLADISKLTLTKKHLIVCRFKQEISIYVKNPLSLITKNWMPVNDLQANDKFLLLQHPGGSLSLFTGIELENNLISENLQHQSSTSLLLEDKVIHFSGNTTRILDLYTISRR